MTIQVGDEVFTRDEGGEWSRNTRTVLYIHHKDPSRKFIVVAYMGDIPTSHFERNVKKPNATGYFWLGKTRYTVEIIDGKPDWSTVKP